MKVLQNNAVCLKWDFHYYACNQTCAFFYFILRNEFLLFNVSRISLHFPSFISPSISF